MAFKKMNPVLQHPLELLQRAQQRPEEAAVALLERRDVLQQLPLRSPLAAARLRSRLLAAAAGALGPMRCARLAAHHHR